MTPVFPEQQVTPVFPDETHRSRKREVEGAGSAAPLVSRLLLKARDFGLRPGSRPVFRAPPDALAQRDPNMPWLGQAPQLGPGSSMPAAIRLGYGGVRR